MQLIHTKVQSMVVLQIEVKQSKRIKMFSYCEHALT